VRLLLSALFPNLTAFIETFIQKKVESNVYKLLEISEKRFWSKGFDSAQPDENHYVGEKSNKERHGVGRVKLPNGDYYIGQWKNNMACGSLLVYVLC